jgi:predicted proteasome-type protease
MHTFVQAGDCMFVLLAAGNLATPPRVIKRPRRLPARLPTAYR